MNHNNKLFQLMRSKKHLIFGCFILCLVFTESHNFLAPLNHFNSNIPNIYIPYFFPNRLFGSFALTGLQSFTEANATNPNADFNDTQFQLKNTTSTTTTTTIYTVSNKVSHRHTARRIPSSSREGLLYWATALLLVLFAGCASGLTVGLMSLDPVQLRVLELEGSDEQKRGIKRVSDVIRRHHLLLVTLLLANSIAMEALPIFLDRLVPAWAAVFLSVTAILLFGEIIPQALCTGKNQLAIAQTAAPFVKFLIAIFFFVAWPIAKLLDHLLGQNEHHAYYARAHLKALIRMHERDRRAQEREKTEDSLDTHSALGTDEVNVIEGALDLAGKTLQQIMLPIQEVFMLEYNTPLNRDTFRIILDTGHSRVPIFSGHRNNVKGFLLTKSLLAVNPEAGVIAGEIMVRRKPIFALPESNLYDLLNEFQKGHSHIAFVTPFVEEHIRCLKAGVDVPPESVLLGIATLEDVIEELIQEEIYDEFDQTGATRPLSVPFPSAAADLNKPHSETNVPWAGSLSESVNGYPPFRPSGASGKLLAAAPHYSYPSLQLNTASGHTLADVWGNYRTLIAPPEESITEERKMSTSELYDVNALPQVVRRLSVDHADGNLLEKMICSQTLPQRQNHISSSLLTPLLSNNSQLTAPLVAKIKILKKPSQKPNTTSLEGKVGERNKSNLFLIAEVNKEKNDPCITQPSSSSSVLRPSNNDFANTNHGAIFYRKPNVSSYKKDLIIQKDQHHKNSFSVNSDYTTSLHRHKQTLLEYGLQQPYRVRSHTWDSNLAKSCRNSTQSKLKTHSELPPLSNSTLIYNHKDYCHHKPGDIPDQKSASCDHNKDNFLELDQKECMSL